MRELRDFLTNQEFPFTLNSLFSFSYVMFCLFACFSFFFLNTIKASYCIPKMLI